MAANKTLLLCLGIIISLLVGCAKAPVKTQEPVPVRVAVVGAKSAPGISNYAGEVRSRYQTGMAFQVGGKIARRLVDVGAGVKAGDPLMELDDNDVRLAAGRAEAQVRAAQADADLAQINYNRYSALYNEAAVSKAEFDKNANLRDSSQARLDDARNAYAAVSRQLGYTTLIADRAGVVVAVNAEVGQVVSQGQQVVVIAQSGEKEVEIHVPEQALREFESPGSIAVTFWAFPETTVQGKVREIAPSADKVTRTYSVQISLIDPPEKIKLGMTANVRVEGSGQRQDLYLPLSALLQTGDQPTVWVVQDNRLVRQTVTVGKYGNNEVQITAGLKPGAVVVTAGVHKLDEGQLVRIWDGGSAP